MSLWASSQCTCVGEPTNSLDPHQLQLHGANLSGTRIHGQLHAPRERLLLTRAPHRNACPRTSPRSGSFTGHSVE